MLQTTHYDQLVSLFARWSYTRLLSYAAYEIQTKVSMGEDVALQVKRTNMHYFYEIREQLRDCLTELDKEVETNLLAMSRDQHDIIYLNKLAATYNEITNYLSNAYKSELARFEGITFDIEAPEGLEKFTRPDGRGGETEFYNLSPDPYWNQYVAEERYLIEDEPPVLITLIKTIVEGFRIAVNILYQAVTQSLVYKHHPERIQIVIPQPIDQNTTSSETVLVEDDKLLTAVQKLLFIRLLQKEGLFPKKPANTDDAPELQAIALLTGISYVNQIKGGNGANAKVNLLLDDRSRRKMTVEQAKPKLKDLDAVGKVARLLNIQLVLSLIDKYRKDLQANIDD